MEATLQVVHIMIFGFGFLIGLWSGVIRERDRQQRLRRQILAARLRRTP
jgi:hypothetical protein